MTRRSTVSKKDYFERLARAGSDAQTVHGHLEVLLTRLPKVKRTYGRGSMKLSGFGGSSVVFQPAPTNKAGGAGLVVQLRDDFPVERASLVRERVADVGGIVYSVFNIVPTSSAAGQWSRVNDHLLVPFLRDGK